MRGKHGGEHGCAVRPRNIPAYAGKTLAIHVVMRVSSEHPRVCGENGLGKPEWFGNIGTSPRMRGKPHADLPFTQELRNIPAYAGKTRKEVTMRVIELEHPRVCGENEKGGDDASY